MCRECLEWKIGAESIQFNLGRGTPSHESIQFNLGEGTPSHANISEKLTFYMMPLRFHKHCSSHIDANIYENRILDKLAFYMMHSGFKLA